MKRRVICLVCAVCLLFAGCSNVGSYEEEESKESLFSDYQYDQERVQSLVEYRNRLTIGPTGYYYIVNNILYYYDIDNDINTPLCSRTECSHNSSGCDAYVYASSTTSENKDANCVGNAIFYYNNHIYMIERSGYETYIIQYDTNFNNKEKLLTLTSGRLNFLGTYGEGHSFAMHDGYMYYYAVINADENHADKDYMGTVSCCRVKLEKGAEPEILGQFEYGTDYDYWGGYSTKVAVSSDNVFFLAGATYRWYGKSNNVQYRVAVYDTKTNTYNMLFSYTSETAEDAWGKDTGIVKDFEGVVCVDTDNNIYLETNVDDKAGVLKVNLITGYSKVIYNSSYEMINSMLCDGNYIYFIEADIGDKMSRVMVIDKEGTVIAAKEFNYYNQYIEFMKELRPDDKEFGLPTNLEINIRCVDNRYIVIVNKSDGLQGLSSGNYSSGNYFSSSRTYPIVGVGIIDKSDFLSGKDCEIKQIYQY